MEIQDKIAFVTGGASGIGRATAQRLKQAGARVVIADIDAEGGARAGEQIGARFVQLDVSDAAAWSRVLEDVVAREGGLDIVHLNAGLLTPVGGAVGGLTSTQDIIALSDADYRKVMSVNIDGVVFGARAAARVMTERGGALVATASVAGLIPFAGDPIYCLTKHAVVGFVRSLAAALQARGITVNAICPAIVRTAITTEEAFDVVSSVGVPVMEPAQIAEAVLEAVVSGETGQALVCLPAKAPIRQAFPELDITGRS